MPNWLKEHLVAWPMSLHFKNDPTNLIGIRMILSLPVVPFYVRCFFLKTSHIAIIGCWLHVFHRLI